MAQIIASPQGMRNFAHGLSELARSIRDRQAQLENELQGLRRTWDDDRYAQFARAVKQASEQLMVFDAKSQLFADYLLRKAAAGERYLRGG